MASPSISPPPIARRPRVMGAAFLAALLLSAATARANDLGQPQNPVITHPHGVPTITTYSSANGGRLVMRGRPVNVQHGPSAAQLRNRAWEYFINPPPPPPPEETIQGWIGVTGGYNFPTPTYMRVLPKP